ncbi:MAG: class I SAM-dependent methyltransferase, partial [Gemmataceae bacterium]|nr:class I SAM-dependent methyltransferase [Gemmataceae bacterium]
MSTLTAMPARSAQTEYEESFTSLDQWRAWLADHSQMQSADYIRTVVTHGQRHGVQSKYLGFIPPQEVRVHDANYRESFLARGFNPRLRAVLDLFAALPAAADTWNTRIYAPEALTPFALLLAGRYARFAGSEYAQTDEQRRSLFPIRAEDLLNLSFPAGVFDVVLSNEVFEHVPNLDRAIAEVARVLKPGGTLIATFPFAYGLADTVVRA